MISIKQSCAILSLITTLFTATAGAQDLNIIPFPESVEVRAGVFQLDTKTKIYYAPGFERQAAFLQQYLDQDYKLTVATDAHNGKDLSKNAIYLNALPAVKGNEAYGLTIGASTISIDASA